MCVCRELCAKFVLALLPFLWCLSSGTGTSTGTGTSPTAEGLIACHVDCGGVVITRLDTSPELTASLSHWPADRALKWYTSTHTKHTWLALQCCADAAARAGASVPCALC